MTANLLTLNCSKTEFLLIRLRKQLDKIHNSSLNTTHSARNLGFIFDQHLTFSDQISAISKACYYHIRQLRCILPYLDSNTACTIATSIVHSKLDYCNFLYYNLPKSEITRLQQIQNSLARAVIKAPKCCHITPILRSHWLKVTECIEYKLLHALTKSSQPPSLRTCITSSLFNLLAALAPHLTLPSLDHQHHPRYAYLIASSGIPHHVSGINFLVLSANLLPVPLSLTCLFMLLPHLLTLSTHHSHHP